MVLVIAIGLFISIKPIHWIQQRVPPSLFMNWPFDASCTYLQWNCSLSQALSWNLLQWFSTLYDFEQCETKHHILENTNQFLRAYRLKADLLMLINFLLHVFSLFVYCWICHPVLTTCCLYNQAELEAIRNEYANAKLECNAADERAKLLAAEVIGLEEKVS